MANTLKIDQGMNGDTWVVKLQGNIDEDADYAPIKTDVAKLQFDFDGINLINSTGIQKWIKFLASVPGASKVSFARCPVKVVNQLNLFPGFFAGKEISIETFYAPYFCEKSGKNYDILLETAKYFADGKEPMAPAMKSPVSGEEMEFDAIEKKYFLFLKRK